MRGNHLTDAFDATVVICTRNRANFLRETLESLATVHVPDAWEVEMLIVNNGSTDDTTRVVRQADLSNYRIRYIEEERKGLSFARNTAVNCAKGNILLFTDDDVRMPENWLIGMTEPIRSGRGDAVAGGVVLAPHLRRPWQESDPWLISVLATTAVLDRQNPGRMVGANMAIGNSVFDRVPGFDTTLGAGAKIGAGEETLFSFQMRSLGFDLVPALDVVVEHHCDEERLLRKSFLQIIEKIGRSQGYIDYHWKHASASPTRVIPKLLQLYAKLLGGRLLRFSETTALEGLPGWEMSLLSQIWHYLQLMRERRHPRKYNPSHASIGALREYRPVSPEASSL